MPKTKTKKPKSAVQIPTQPAVQPTQQPAPAESKKNNTIFWVCGCCACCLFAVIALIIIFWALNFFGAFSLPGLLGSIRGY